MTKNIIHFFDLDQTLIKTDAKWWIVSKDNPTKPVIKITQEEGSLVSGGYYKKHGNHISYNGMEGWLSDELYDRCRNHELNSLGISTREFHEKEYIDKQADNLVVLIEHIKHLKDTKDTIAILTARGNRDDHNKVLEKLKEELDNHNLNIDFEKIYFVGDSNYCRHEGLTPEKKCYIILEHIVGFRIKDQQFVPVQQEAYDEVHFYDDEEKNVEAVLNANTYIKTFLARTDEELAEEIEKYLTEKKVKLYVYKTTTNKLNPFVTNMVEIAA